MRELRTSGSVGGGGGNSLVYPTEYRIFTFRRLMTTGITCRQVDNSFL